VTDLTVATAGATNIMATPAGRSHRSSSQGLLLRSPNSMPSPANCRFSESHEWFRVEGDVVTMGITQYAANELTDITYVEMKPAGTKVAAGGAVGEVESVKTTSDVYSAVAGAIAEVNPALASDPGLLNSDPYGKGWLIKIKTSDSSPLNKLMDQKTYDQKHPA
jgi:glycine cleavage system H protein